MKKCKLCPKNALKATAKPHRDEEKDEDREKMEDELHGWSKAAQSRSPGLNKYLQCILLCVYGWVCDHTLHLLSIPAIFVSLSSSPASRQHYPPGWGCCLLCVCLWLVCMCEHAFVCVSTFDAVMQICSKNMSKICVTVCVCRVLQNFSLNINYFSPTLFFNCLTHSHKHTEFICQWLCFISTVEKQGSLIKD